MSRPMNTTGQVAAALGVTTRTIRWWEAKGLVTIGRQGRHRVYGPDTIERLGAIRRQSRYGFSLDEIKAGVTRAQLVDRRKQLFADSRRLVWTIALIEYDIDAMEDGSYG